MPVHVLWRNGWVAIPSGRARQSSSAREPLLPITYGLAPRRFLSESRSRFKNEKTTKTVASAAAVVETSKSKTLEDPALIAACQRMAGVPKALPQVLTSIIEDPPVPAWRDVGEKLRSSILLVDRKIEVDVSVASRLAYMIPLVKRAIPRDMYGLHTTLYAHLADLIETAVKAGKKDVAFSKVKYMEWLKEHGHTKRGHSIAVAEKTQSTTEKESVAGSSKSPYDQAMVEVNPHTANPTKKSVLLNDTVAKGTAGSVNPDTKEKGKDIQGDKVITKASEPQSPSAAATSMPQENSTIPASKMATTTFSKAPRLAAGATPPPKEKAKPSLQVDPKKTATGGRSLDKAETQATVLEPKDTERQTAFKSQSTSSVEPLISPLRQKAIAKLGTERLSKSKDPEIVQFAAIIPELLGFMPKGRSYVKSAKWSKKIGYLHDAAIATGSFKDKIYLRNEIKSFLGFIINTVRPEGKEVAQSLLATFTVAGKLSDGDLANKRKSTEDAQSDPASADLVSAPVETDPNSIQVEKMVDIPSVKVVARKRAKRLAERVGASSRPVRPTRTALRASRVVTKKASKKSRKLDADDADASQATLDGLEQDHLTSLKPSSTVPLKDAEPSAKLIAAAVALPGDAVESDNAAAVALEQDPTQMSTPRGYEAVAKRERRIRVAMEAKKAAAAQLNALNALGKPIDESTLHEGVPQPVLALMSDAKMAAAAEEQSVQVLRQIRYTPAIKRNAVMISTERARVQEKAKAEEETKIIFQQDVGVMGVPDASSAAEPVLITTPPILPKRPRSPVNSLEEPVDVSPLPETSPESAPVAPSFFNALKGGLRSAWGWLGGDPSVAPSPVEAAETPGEPSMSPDVVISSNEDTITEQIDDLFAGLQRNKKDFGQALEEELARHAEEQSVELLAYRENFHRTSGVSYLPADLKQQLDYQDVAIGQVNFLEDRRRVMWEFSHWTSVEGSLWVDKDKSRKEAYRAFHHAVNHPDPTLMIYSDGSFRDSQMGRTTSQRFAGGGVHVKTPLPISYSLSLGTTMRGSNEAELATYLWAIRMVRTLLTSPIGEAIRAEQNYKRVLFATDSTNTLRLLSRIRQGGVPDSRTIMLLSMVQVEAIALSRLFGGMDILGIWVPREFNKEIQLADELAVKGSAQARRTSVVQPQPKKGKKK